MRRVLLWIIIIVALVGEGSLALAEPGDLTPGSSIQNEDELDWSERDNRAGGPVGSEFEELNQPPPGIDYGENERVWRERVDERDAQVQEQRTPPRMERQVIVIEPRSNRERRSVISSDVVTQRAEASPSPARTSDSDVEVIYGAPEEYNRDDVREGSKN